MAATSTALTLNKKERVNLLRGCLALADDVAGERGRFCLPDEFDAGALRLSQTVPNATLA